MTNTTSIKLQLERIRAAAQTGLNYSRRNKSYCDLELYETILSACEYISLGGSESATDIARWRAVLSDLGYITPKAGSVVGIVRDDGCLLVLQRCSGRWCLPCGYSDIGETPEETATREAFEETGLTLKQLRFIKLTTSGDDDSVPFMWEAIYITRTRNSSIRLSHEHINYKWIETAYGIDWHSTHYRHAELVLQMRHYHQDDWQ